MFLALALSLGAAITAGALLGRHSASVPSASVIARGQASIREFAAEIRPNTTMHTLTRQYDFTGQVPGESREEWYAFGGAGELAWVGAIDYDAHGRVKDSGLQYPVAPGTPTRPIERGQTPQLPTVSIPQFVQTLTENIKLPDPDWGTPDATARRTSVRGSTAYAVTFRGSEGATVVFFDARTSALLREEWRSSGPGHPLTNRNDELTFELLPGDAIPPALKDAPVVQ